MRISTFFYTIRQGLVNIWKNKMFSLASIATMTACIFLFGLFYAIVTNFQAMVRDVESGVAVTVLFDAGISEQRIEEIGELIDERIEVSRYEFTSADEAWEYFRDIYFEGNEEAAESFGADNYVLIEEGTAALEGETFFWVSALEKPPGGSVLAHYFLSQDGAELYCFPEDWLERTGLTLADLRHGEPETRVAEELGRHREILVWNHVK